MQYWNKWVFSLDLNTERVSQLMTANNSHQVGIDILILPYYLCFFCLFFSQPILSKFTQLRSNISLGNLYFTFPLGSTTWRKKGMSIFTNATEQVQLRLVRHTSLLELITRRRVRFLATMLRTRSATIVLAMRCADLDTDGLWSCSVSTTSSSPTAVHISPLNHNTQ